MEQLNVRIKEKVKEYPIFIGNSLLPLVKEFLEKNHKDKKPVIITDSNVKEMCKEKISDILKGLNPALIFIPAGESIKSKQMKEKFVKKSMKQLITGAISLKKGILYPIKLTERL